MAMNREAIVEARRLSASGYVCASNTHHMALRIDRRDWVDRMIEKQYPNDEARGVKWVSGMGLRDAAEHYRRVHTTDRITVSKDVYLALKRLNKREIQNDFRPLQLVAPRNVRLEP